MKPASSWPSSPTTWLFWKAPTTRASATASRAASTTARQAVRWFAFSNCTASTSAGRGLGARGATFRSPTTAPLIEQSSSAPRPSPEELSRDPSRSLETVTESAAWKTRRTARDLQRRVRTHRRVLHLLFPEQKTWPRGTCSSTRVNAQGPVEATVRHVAKLGLESRLLAHLAARRLGRRTS